MPIAQCGDLEIAYDERGTGAPLVLLMGLGSQMIMWPEPFCDALAARGFRVIRMDNRDIGLSSKFHGRRTPPLPALIARGLLGVPSSNVPYSLFDMAGDVIALLDHLDIERAHVVGVSLGSMIAQCVAIAHPERLHSIGLFMTTPGVGVRWLPRMHALRSFLRPLPRDRDGHVDGVVDVLRTLAGPHMPVNEAVLRGKVTEAFERCHYPAGPVRHLAAVLAGGDRTRALRRVRTPAVVIHGASDPLIPVAAGRAAAKALRARAFVEIPRLGHSMPEESWPPIIAAIAGHAHSHTPTAQSQMTATPFSLHSFSSEP